MGKLVEAIRLGYYGNARRRTGDQFVMADADFKKQVFEEKDGKQMPVPGKFEDQAPSWVVVVEDGYEDPIIPKEEKAAKPMKRVVPKAKPDDHRQGGAFDVHPESGIQVTGQVAPAKPAASSFQGAASPAPEIKPASVEKKSTGKDAI